MTAPDADTGRLGTGGGRWGMRSDVLRHGAGHDSSRVGYIELFFDLVFVFAVTQLSHMLIDHTDAPTLVQTLVLAWAIWWLWIDTTWVTNWLDPEKVPVRTMLLVLMLLGLLMSSAIPEAFGDKAVLFAIPYVLIQLIRNAVVHGIESPAERQAQGKSPEGHIRIQFEIVENGRAFRMQCEDDGRGLTADKLRKTAVTKGIISQQDATSLSDQEAMMLVFRSGFSTASGVTRDAGRGVGMDVIAEIAARLGGRISLNSESGKNMRLSLSFPANANAAGVVAA